MTASNILQAQFDNSYYRDLEGCYVAWQGVVAPKPEVIRINHQLADELGFNIKALTDDQSAEIFSGSKILEGSVPIAQVYAGHQFGGFTPILGDGRALLLGEVLDRDGMRRDIQLKGSGRTPFSRQGDGKAAIGPVLREYLISEAMYALGVPTTRSLAAVTTGEKVLRESQLPGAILTRVASSHLRVGTFEFFAAREDIEKVRLLADYSISRHYPDVSGQSDQYLLFLSEVLDAQAKLVAKWMAVGFIHGVMNTDNTTISGETIDYGPCAFMDQYDPASVFSSIDLQGRYAYQNQPTMAIWNITRLAEALLPLFDDNQEKGVEKATAVLESFSEKYYKYWLQNMRSKLGLVTERKEDMELVKGLLKSLEGQHIDFTNLFIGLSKAAEGDQTSLLSLFDDAETIAQWLALWRHRLDAEEVPMQTRLGIMARANPRYIPRNHKVEEALDAATYEQNFEPFKKLLAILESPFEAHADSEEFDNPAPESKIPYRTFCGT